MRQPTRFVVAFVFLLFLPAFGAAQQDSLAASRARHVQEILNDLGDRARLPGREVFENLQIMGDMPAERVLRIMDMGYSRSLGVGCDHCHVTSEWASDTKEEKDIARAMMRFARQLNADLRAIPELEGREPAVNCTTCHRGQIEPALNLDE